VAKKNETTLVVASANVGEWELGVSLSLALSALSDILIALVQKVAKNNSVLFEMI
jgi:hypothetical protein